MTSQCKNFFSLGGLYGLCRVRNENDNGCETGDGNPLYCSIRLREKLSEAKKLLKDIYEAYSFDPEVHKIVNFMKNLDVEMGEDL